MWMPVGRPVVPIVLEDWEQEKLRLVARRPKTSQRDSMRARVILSAAQGLSNLKIAEQLGIHNTTVGKWRNRFAKDRMDGLFDAPRSGAPRKVSDKKVEAVVTKTLERKPKGKTHWSTREMAKSAGISHQTVKRIWNAFGLKPHLVDHFKFSTDPFFVEKVRDIVGLYLNPPDKAMLFCVDEKSQAQALERAQPIFPMRPGIPETQTHDYIRHGTTSLFAALNVLIGEVFGKCKNRHRHQEFLSFMRALDKQIPKEDGREIHLVMDNYATHKVDKVKRWFAKRPYYHVHFTPTGSSWINQIERWFALLTEQCIRRGSFRSVNDLEQRIDEFIEANNEDPKPFKWTASADYIFQRIENQTI